MATNTNFNAQGTAVPGGYAQPSPGVTEQIETPADPSGNAYATELASGGTAVLEEGLYRDTVVTVQVMHTASAPAAAAVVATITPGTAGNWEISGYVTVTGTTVAATDTNNMALNKTSTAILSPIPMLITGTTGSTVFWPIPVTVATLTGADTVNVTAIANATASSVYQACIVARRVG